MCGSQVVYDTDGDYALTEGEWNTVTGARGAYSVETPERNGTGTLVMGHAAGGQGCIDQLTGQAPMVCMAAPTVEDSRGAVMLSPITTLVAEMMRRDATLDRTAAAALVSAGLRIDSSLDMMHADVIRGMLEGSAEATDAFSTITQLMNTVNLIGQFLNGFANATGAAYPSVVQRTHMVFGGLASALLEKAASNSTLRLASQVDVAHLILGVVDSSPYGEVETASSSSRRLLQTDAPSSSPDVAAPTPAPSAAPTLSLRGRRRALLLGNVNALAASASVLNGIIDEAVVAARNASSANNSTRAAGNPSPALLLGITKALATSGSGTHLAQQVEALGSGLADPVAFTTRFADPEQTKLLVSNTVVPDSSDLVAEIVEEIRVSRIPPPPPPPPPLLPPPPPLLPPLPPAPELVEKKDSDIGQWVKADVGQWMQSNMVATLLIIGGVVIVLQACVLLAVRRRKQQLIGTYTTYDNAAAEPDEEAPPHHKADFTPAPARSDFSTRRLSSRFLNLMPKSSKIPFLPSPSSMRKAAPSRKVGGFEFGEAHQSPPVNTTQSVMSSGGALELKPSRKSKSPLGSGFAQQDSSAVLSPAAILKAMGIEYLLGDDDVEEGGGFSATKPATTMPIMSLREQAASRRKQILRSGSGEQTTPPGSPDRGSKFSLASAERKTARRSTLSQASGSGEQSTRFSVIQTEGTEQRGPSKPIATPKKSPGKSPKMSARQRAYLAQQDDTGLSMAM